MAQKTEALGTRIRRVRTYQKQCKILSDNIIINFDSWCIYLFYRSRSDRQERFIISGLYRMEYIPQYLLFHNSIYGIGH